jgi:hypothetical protein
MIMPRPRGAQMRRMPPLTLREITRPKPIVPEEMLERATQAGVFDRDARRRRNGPSMSFDGFGE